MLHIKQDYSKIRPAEFVTHYNPGVLKKLILSQNGRNENFSHYCRYVAKEIFF